MKRKKDAFVIFCYLDMLIVILLFLLELFNIFCWTMESIIVLSFILILSLLPFFAEIQIGEYGFKRKDDKKQE